VTFDDGGTATGSFVFDAETTTFSSINIITSANPAGLGTTYGVPTGVGDATFFDTIEAFPPAGNDRLFLDLRAPMTNAGGILGINIAVEGPALTTAAALCFPPE
jgi:hypothetical protein